MKNDKKSAATKTAANAKKEKSRVALIAVAAITLITLVVGITVGILTSRDLDYINDNLDKYIFISEQDYKNYNVKVSLDEITDRDVEAQIMMLLCENRDKNPLFDGGYVKMPISVGDEAYLYYRGYTVDENGKETDIDNACNISDSEPYALTIGSSGFIPGFEEGLIGLTPDKFLDLERHESGEVLPTDVIYLTYKVLLPDGKVEEHTAKRIDLNSDSLDEIYGKGFSAFFTEGDNGFGGKYKKRIIGEAISDLDENGKMQEEFLFQMEGKGSALYYDMKVTLATREESGAFTVDAYFPKNYRVAELAGVKAKFDVFVKYIISYDTPEFDDAFIKETLKVSEEDLASFTGDTITDKYRSMVKKELELQREEARRTVIEDAMWVQYNKCAEIKKYPEREVKKFYNNLLDELEKAYETYSYSYSSIDEFACVYYKLDKLADWRAHVRTIAEDAVKEKLVFYYVARAEGLIPEGEEYERLYAEAFDEYLTYYKENMYKAELINAKDDREKEKIIEKIRKEILDYYGEDYFKEEAIYTFALEKMLAFAKVEE